MGDDKKKSKKKKSSRRHSHAHDSDDKDSRSHFLLPKSKEKREGKKEREKQDIAYLAILYFTVALMTPLSTPLRRSAHLHWRLFRSFKRIQVVAAAEKGLVFR